MATAEFVLYFGGRLPDMKVTGLALWRSEGDTGITLTLPARQGSAGEYYCFRPVSGEIQDLVHFKREVVRAYLSWAAGAGSTA